MHCTFKTHTHTRRGYTLSLQGDTENNAYLNVKMNLCLPIATEIINVTATERSMIYTNVVHIFIPVKCLKKRKREEKNNNMD